MANVKCEIVMTQPGLLNRKIGRWTSRLPPRQKPHKLMVVNDY